MKLFLLAMAAGLCPAQVPIYPRAMPPLRMLLGRWAVEGAGRGWIEFHMSRDTKEIIGRAKPTGAGAQWERMMAIYAEGSPVRADFFESRGRIIHYRLDYFDAHTLRFVTDPSSGGPVRTLTYEKHGQGRLSYRFETDGRTTDSGRLYATAELRLLTDSPRGQTSGDAGGPPSERSEEATNQHDALLGIFSLFEVQKALIG
jgi:hypothetical protein